MISFIKNNDVYTLFVSGKQYCIKPTHPNYLEIEEFLKSSDLTSDGSVSKMVELADVRETYKAFCKGEVEVLGDDFYYGGQQLNNYVTTKIVQMRQQGFDVDPLLNFLGKVMDNPSRTAAEELYLFLEQSHLPITPDGDFLAYKRVKDNFYDMYSGTIDHSVGKHVEMPRNQVDDNRMNTCSYGLHFCSLSYLPHYGSNQGRIVVVKINPADVVSIPSDYNNAKGRTCSYFVEAEYLGEQNTHAFDKSRPVHSDEDYIDQRFRHHSADEFDELFEGYDEEDDFKSRDEWGI